MVIMDFLGLSEVPQYGGGSADMYQSKYTGHQVAVKVIQFHLSSNRDNEQSVGTAFCTPHQKIPGD